MRKRTRLRYSIQSLGETTLWWYTPQKIWSSHCSDTGLHDPVTQEPTYRWVANGAFAKTFAAALRIARKVGQGNQAEITRLEVKHGRCHAIANWIVEGD
jgi:hypothetical protein